MDRAAWVDVYLRPADGDHHGDSFCLTVDAVGAKGNACYSAEEKAAACAKLRGVRYHIDGQKMIVPGEAYSKEELLGWVRVWLEASGFTVGRLVEGTYEEFRGRAGTAGWWSRQGSGRRKLTEDNRFRRTIRCT